MKVVRSVQIGKLFDEAILASISASNAGVKELISMAATRALALCKTDVERRMVEARSLESELKAACLRGYEFEIRCAWDRICESTLFEEARKQEMIKMADKFAKR